MLPSVPSIDFSHFSKKKHGFFAEAESFPRCSTGAAGNLDVVRRGSTSSSWKSGGLGSSMGLSSGVC